MPTKYSDKSAQSALASLFAVGAQRGLYSMAFGLPVLFGLISGSLYIHFGNPRFNPNDLDWKAPQLDPPSIPFLHTLFDRSQKSDKVKVQYTTQQSSDDPFQKKDDSSAEEFETSDLTEQTGRHLLGTDNLRRDILMRLLAGTNTYLLPSLIAIGISLIFGTILGCLSGYFHESTLDKAATYVTSTLSSIPRFIVLLVVICAFRPTIYYIVATLGVVSAPRTAQLIQNKILSLKESDFIDAARELGLSDIQIIFKHILWYNCKALFIVQIAYGFADVILVESSLSYLGYGVQEPLISWGNMVASGKDEFFWGRFWVSAFPTFAIVLSILGFQSLGDGLTRWFDIKRETGSV